MKINTSEGVTSYGINLDVPVDELVSKTYSSKEIIKESKSTPASSRERKRPKDIPEQLQPIVLKVVGRINKLAGTGY